MSGLVGLPNNIGSGTIGPPSGTIIKVVSTNGSSTYTTTSDAWGSSTKIADLETTHTCASSSNKVILSASFIGIPKTTFLYTDFYKIISGTTTLNLSGEVEGFARCYHGSALHVQVQMQYLFSPSSTAAHTYGVSFRSYTNVSAQCGGNDSASNLTVMEIQT